MGNIAANASKVEKAENAEKEREQRRNNHAKHVHGICKRLQEMGLEGKYLGEYEHNLQALNIPHPDDIQNEVEAKYEVDGSAEGDGEEEEVMEETDAKNVVQMALSPLPAMITDGQDDEHT